MDWGEGVVRELDRRGVEGIGSKGNEGVVKGLGRRGQVDWRVGEVSGLTRGAYSGLGRRGVKRLGRKGG